MITVDEARALLGAHRPDKGAEIAPLRTAKGRRLAAAVAAKVSRPPADVSAMDGYAVRLADVGAPGARLRVIGEAPAGAPFHGAVEPGQAVRIFTGSVAPQGADHVVIQEEAAREGDAVICRQAYDTPQFIRRAGRDFEAGAPLLSAGHRIDAAALSVLAAANVAEVSVVRRPRIGLLANGDELKPVGSELKPGEIVNSNPIGLGALIEDWGGEAVDLGVAPDSEAAIRTHIEQAADIDLFLPIGGASVGDHDHMRAAFAGSGFTPVFERVAVKPGKPTWFSSRGDQRVLGLPGNPASAFVCAHLFLRPLLIGEDAPCFRQAKLAAPIEANGPREAYLRAALGHDKTGQARIRAAKDQDSSLIMPFLTADALIRRLPNAPAACEGDLIDYLSL